MSLDELRRALLSPAVGAVVRDAVWRELVVRSRRDGPAWVVASVGMALPGLRRAAGRLASGWKGDTEDLDAELLLGFVARLKTLDVEGPRVCGRLLDAGVRAARRMRDRYADAQLIRTDVAVSRLPMLPFDHPELVLARAVAAAVIDADEANLIGATRLGTATLAQASAEFGIAPGRAQSWRRSAERRLAAAIRDGELDEHLTIRPARGGRRRRTPDAVVEPVLGDEAGNAPGLAGNTGPLVVKKSARTPAAGFGAAGRAAGLA